MGKIKDYFKQTSEITNGDRLNIVVSTVVLVGMGFILNNELFKSRIEGLAKDCKISELEKNLLEKESKELSDDNKTEEN